MEQEYAPTPQDLAELDEYLSEHESREEHDWLNDPNWVGSRHHY